MKNQLQDSPILINVNSDRMNLSSTQILGQKFQEKKELNRFGE